jgi:L-fuconolactonase
VSAERIDAHQHFWTLARGDYGWLTPALAPIYRDYAPSDLAPLLAESGIGRTVLVQAAPTEAETDYLLDLAAGTWLVAGVVGWVNFEAPDAAQRVRRAARRSKLVGLRPMIHDLPDDRWMLRSQIEPALVALAETGLAFDALVRPRHLTPLIELTARHPALRVVIDHAAKPDIARWHTGDAEFRAWAGQLETLAGRGLFCKLSGLVTEARPDWQVDDLRPYVEAVLAAFGPDRVIWGSDWPVVERAGGYRRWRQATEELLGGPHVALAAAVLGGNARHFYRLPG